MTAHRQIFTPSLILPASLIRFDNLTNGFSTQAVMDEATDVFANEIDNEIEEVADGAAETT